MSATISPVPTRDELLDALAAIRAASNVMQDVTESGFQDETLAVVYDRLIRSWFPDDESLVIEDGSNDEPWHRNPACVETYARADEMRALIFEDFAKWKVSQELQVDRRAYELNKMAKAYRERGTINIGYGEAVAS